MVIYYIKRKRKKPPVINERSGLAIFGAVAGKFYFEKIRVEKSSVIKLLSFPGEGGVTRRVKSYYFLMHVSAAVSSVQQYHKPPRGDWGKDGHPD